MHHIAAAAVVTLKTLAVAMLIPLAPLALFRLVSCLTQAVQHLGFNAEEAAARVLAAALALVAVGAVMLVVSSYRAMGPSRKMSAPTAAGLKAVGGSYGQT